MLCSKLSEPAQISGSVSKKRALHRTLLESFCLHLALRSKYQEYQGRIVVVCTSKALSFQMYFTRTLFNVDTIGKQNRTNQV